MTPGQLITPAAEPAAIRSGAKEQLGPSSALTHNAGPPAAPLTSHCRLVNRHSLTLAALANAASWGRAGTCVMHAQRRGWATGAWRLLSQALGASQQGAAASATLGLAPCGGEGNGGVGDRPTCVWGTGQRGLAAAPLREAWRHSATAMRCRCVACPAGAELSAGLRASSSGGGSGLWPTGGLAAAALGPVVRQQHTQAATTSRQHGHGRQGVSGRSMAAMTHAAPPALTCQGVRTAQSVAHVSRAGTKTSVVVYTIPMCGNHCIVSCDGRRDCSLGAQTPRGATAMVHCVHDQATTTIGYIYVCSTLTCIVFLRPT